MVGLSAVIMEGLSAVFLAGWPEFFGEEVVVVGIKIRAANSDQRHTLSCFRTNEDFLIYISKF